MNVKKALKNGIHEIKDKLPIEDRELIRPLQRMFGDQRREIAGKNRRIAALECDLDAARRSNRKLEKDLQESKRECHRQRQLENRGRQVIVNQPSKTIDKEPLSLLKERIAFLLQVNGQITEAGKSMPPFALLLTFEQFQRFAFLDRGTERVCSIKEAYQRNMDLLLVRCILAHVTGTNFFLVPFSEKAFERYVRSKFNRPVRNRDERLMLLKEWAVEVFRKNPEQAISLEQLLKEFLAG